MIPLWRQPLQRSVSLFSTWRRINWSRRWELIETIARTHEAEVLKVRCRRTGHRRALKLVSADMVLLQDGYWPEAQCVLTLRHESIVRAWQQGRIRDGRYLLELDYVDGESLMSRLHQTGAWPVSTALPVLIQIGSALSYVHWLGWLHGDLCPHNVLVDSASRTATLIDFGRAERFGNRVVPTLRRHSLAYAAPEQRCPFQPPTVSAEIYSFGLLAAELLTGRLPATSAGARPQGLENLPSPLASLLEQCLEPRPEQRPRNMRVVVEKLANARRLATSTKPR